MPPANFKILPLSNSQPEARSYFPTKKPSIPITGTRAMLRVSTHFHASIAGRASSGTPVFPLYTLSAVPGAPGWPTVHSAIPAQKCTSAFASCPLSPSGLAARNLPAYSLRLRIISFGCTYCTPLIFFRQVIFFVLNILKIIILRLSI